jgi:RND family efflux transporter MFP subunit
MNRSLFLAASCWLLLGSAVRADDLKKVIVAQPVEREIADDVNFTGRTEAVTSVKVRARVTGFVEKVHVRPGAAVKKGDLLFEIDPRPYRLELEKADAEVTRATATLKAAQAQYDRAKKLRADGAVTAEEVDRLVALTEAADAMVKVARANVEIQRLNLSWTRVAAPIDGKVSGSVVDAGNLIKADESLLTTITQYEPIQVAFDMDQRTLLRLRKGIKDGKIKEPAAIRMALADEEGFPHVGRIESSDVQFDEKTGTIRVRALFPNLRQDILPGMFVRLQLPAGSHKGLVVSVNALQSEGARTNVYIVDDKNTIKRRDVQRGSLPKGAKFVEIVDGLKEKDRVVVGGDFVKVGDEVKVERAAPTEEKPQK